jgi:hypothetical protein
MAISKHSYRVLHKVSTSLAVRTAKSTQNQGYYVGVQSRRIELVASPLAYTDTGQGLHKHVHVEVAGNMTQSH